MLKKRIIFTLLVEDGSFVLSRNFNLQRAGNLDWLKEYYDFNSIAFSIDELVVLDVSRSERNRGEFVELLADISRNCFMPICVGGGVRSSEDASLLLKCGADKVVVNSVLFTDSEVVRDMVQRFGAQCIVAAIDYKTLDSGETSVLIQNGTRSVGMTIGDAIRYVQELGVGEIYLTSVSRDGTGRGLDLSAAVSMAPHLSCPLILSGGAGTFEHIADALKEPSVSAVSTANLFNFMGDNLTEARMRVVAAGTPLARWAGIN